MAITIGTVASANNSSETTTSVAVDAGSGSNRCLYAAIGQRDSTIDSVTFNGAALTPVEDLVVSPDLSLYLYRIVNPDSGSHALTVTYVSAPAQSLIIGIPMEGVDQSTPEDAAVTADGLSGPITANITSGNGDLVMGFGYVGYIAGGGSITANQTSVFDADQLFGGVRGAAIGTTAGDGGSKTISFNLTSEGVWGEILINVNAAAGGGITDEEIANASRQFGFMPPKYLAKRRMSQYGVFLTDPLPPRFDLLWYPTYPNAIKIEYAAVSSGQISGNNRP